MPNYDFRALPPVDFELLVRDLLQKQFRITLESFKPGRDKGIDLRYCTSRRNDLVIQCKHYVDSGVERLIHDLGQVERPKVRRLKPKRYVITTSVGLTPNQKETIRNIFYPACKSTGDVFGKADLNNLLTKFPQVEKVHFKLWLSSVAVMERIIHNRVYNVSRDELERIRQKTKYYVQNQSFNEALRILKTSNYCVIAGIPGIGKTTLAEMLVIYFLRHHYEFVKISSDISEARDVDYRDVKRIFYYDDFLGQSSDAEKLGKNEDERLLNFIDAIKTSGVSKLILTTREYILNQAKMRYEKLSRAHFDLDTCVVDLRKYTRLNRAQILFNHIYFSELPSEFKRQLLENKDYLKIIDHDNYNPRLVQYLTDETFILGLKAEAYPSFFIDNLDDPHRLWQHAFEYQISSAGRHLLSCLATAPYEVFLEDLRSVFEGFHSRRIGRTSSLDCADEFMYALKELDGNFIQTEKLADRIVVRFHNPSIRDFLQRRLSRSPRDVVLLLKTAVFFEQVAWLCEFSIPHEQRSSFRQIIRQRPKTLLRAIKRTIEKQGCSLTYDWIERDGDWVEARTTEESSLEERLTRLARISSHFYNVPLMNFFEHLLVDVCARVKTEESNKRHVVELLEGMVSNGQFSKQVVARLANAAKQFVLKDLSTVQDIETAMQFHKICPSRLDDEELEHVREGFMQSYRLEMRDWLSESRARDPDELREWTNRLEELDDWLDAGAWSDLEELNKRARELEKKAEEKSDKTPSPIQYKREEGTDQEITSLFESLPL